MAADRSRFSWVPLLGGILVLLTVGTLWLVPSLFRSSSPAQGSGHASDGGPLPIFREVTSFALTNEFGQGIGLNALLGKTTLVHIIFTRCPGPCPRMSEIFSRIQRTIPGDGSVRLLTLTTDPEFDTPEVLLRYAKRFGFQSNIWTFATGDRKEIRKLAIEGLGLTALNKDASQQEGENDLFIHSTISVLVDSRGRVRATLETLEPDAMDRVQELLRRLKEDAGESH